MAQQLERDSPLLAIAVEGGGVLIDAHDQADAVLEVLVGEGDAVAYAEVRATADLRWRTRPLEFRIRWCRGTFGGPRGRMIAP